MVKTRILVANFALSPSFVCFLSFNFLFCVLFLFYFLFFLFFCIMLIFTVQLHLSKWPEAGNEINENDIYIKVTKICDHLGPHSRHGQQSLRITDMKILQILLEQVQFLT